MGKDVCPRTKEWKISRSAPRQGERLRIAPDASGDSPPPLRQGERRPFPCRGHAGMLWIAMCPHHPVARRHPESRPCGCQIRSSPDPPRYETRLPLPLREREQISLSRRQIAYTHVPAGGRSAPDADADHRTQAARPNSRTKDVPGKRRAVAGQQGIQQGNIHGSTGRDSGAGRAYRRS